MDETANAWRRESPGNAGWPRSARPGAANKYFMVSADCHANEPNDFLAKRIDPKLAHRLPRVEVDEKGERWQITEGYRPSRIRFKRPLEGEDGLRNASGATPEERLRDMEADGVDAEIIFPNKGLSIWATPAPEFAMACCRCWNDWAWETFGPYNDRMSPMACLATGDLEGSIAEVQRAAKLGFRGLTLPSKPIFSPHDARQPNYNLPMFDPLWAAIQDTGLPMTFHVSTGRDPRAAKGNGGAVINYVSHSLAPTIEPLANLCASGVFERFPKLRFATIEAGIGWVAWALAAMDEAYKKHHMWVQPKLGGLPSDYFRTHGMASFQEDEPGLRDAQAHDLAGNFMWANDYPHHEGTWPHSAAAIERTMGFLTDGERAQILGLNAARFFGFEVPEGMA
ncbi:MAG: amidohydrolase family protein [Gammaproteobacteria bacterium]|nr:amidohydrolase family protein [Gammaproteobacteria bacterium]MDE0269930.1 amidohydrolase family protein [Gammaproteobacteria bacterium]